MASSGEYPLTEFLLDLTDVEGLYEEFKKDPDRVLGERGLGEYRELLVPEKDYDVPSIREAVRRELIRGERAPSDLDKIDIIRGIRPPPNGKP